MSVAEDAAIAIMDSLHRAEAYLLGREFAHNGDPAGYIKAVKLDDDHGIKVTGNHLRWFPLSSITVTS